VARCYEVCNESIGNLSNTCMTGDLYGMIMLCEILNDLEVVSGYSLT